MDECLSKTWWNRVKDNTVLEHAADEDDWRLRIKGATAAGLHGKWLLKLCVCAWFLLVL